MRLSRETFLEAFRQWITPLETALLITETAWGNRAFACSTSLASTAALTFLMMFFTIVL